MGALVKSRKFRVGRVEDPRILTELRGKLEELPGVINLRLEEEQEIIRVEYDLLKTNAKEIQRVLRSSNAAGKSSLLGAVKWAMVHFTEENERDNFTAPASPCCSNPGKMLDRKASGHRG